MSARGSLPATHASTRTSAATSAVIDDARIGPTIGEDAHPIATPALVLLHRDLLRLSAPLDAALDEWFTCLDSMARAAATLVNYAPRWRALNDAAARTAPGDAHTEADALARCTDRRYDTFHAPAEVPADIDPASVRTGAFIGIFAHSPAHLSALGVAHARQVEVAHRLMHNAQ
jgi:hypothetical protein